MSSVRGQRCCFSPRISQTVLTTLPLTLSACLPVCLCLTRSLTFSVAVSRSLSKGFLRFPSLWFSLFCFMISSRCRPKIKCVVRQGPCTVRLRPTETNLCFQCFPHDLSHFCLALSVLLSVCPALCSLLLTPPAHR